MAKESICAVDVCGKNAAKGSYCTKHYQRWRRHGDPLIVWRPKEKCSIDGCGKKHLAQGYCKNHYWSFKTYGDATVRKIARTEDIEAFVESLSQQESDDCIAWPFGKLPNGYGSARVGRKSTSASRMVCEKVCGLAPSKDHQAAHSCGKGHEGCVNPRHLRWRTPLENTLEKNDHGTMLRGAKAPGAKLSEANILEIRGRLNRGDKVTHIAKDFSVWPACISRIKNGQRWSHL